MNEAARKVFVSRSFSISAINVLELAIETRCTRQPLPLMQNSWNFEQAQDE